MSIGIKTTLQADGSLLFQAGNETRSDLAQALRESYQRAESDFIELVRGEQIAKKEPLKGTCYNLEWLNPADIFALTEMPMFADNCRDDDDAVRVYGPVWGFPDYMIRCYLEEIAHTGRVVFPLVMDFGEEGITFPSRWNNKELADHLAKRAFETCLDNPILVTEEVPDIHSDEEGKTIRRVVDIAPAPPSPVVRPLI